MPYLVTHRSALNFFLSHSTQPLTALPCSPGSPSTCTTPPTGPPCFSFISAPGYPQHHLPCFSISASLHQVRSRSSLPTSYITAPRYSLAVVSSHSAVVKAPCHTSPLLALPWFCQGLAHLGQNSLPYQLLSLQHALLCPPLPVVLHHIVLISKAPAPLRMAPPLRTKPVTVETYPRSALTASCTHHSYFSIQSSSSLSSGP